MMLARVLVRWFDSDYTSKRGAFCTNSGWKTLRRGSHTPNPQNWFIKLENINHDNEIRNKKTLLLHDARVHGASGGGSKLCVYSKPLFGDTLQDIQFLRQTKVHVALEGFVYLLCCEIAKVEKRAQQANYQRTGTMYTWLYIVVVQRRFGREREISQATLCLRNRDTRQWYCMTCIFQFPFFSPSDRHVPIGVHRGGLVHCVATGKYLLGFWGRTRVVHCTDIPLKRAGRDEFLHWNRIHDMDYDKNKRWTASDHRLDESSAWSKTGFPMATHRLDLGKFVGGATGDLGYTQSGEFCLQLFEDGH